MFPADFGGFSSGGPQKIGGDAGATSQRLDSKNTFNNNFAGRGRGIMTTSKLVLYVVVAASILGGAYYLTKMKKKKSSYPAQNKAQKIAVEKRKTATKTETKKDEK